MGRGLVMAYVLTSLSGNLISAASAGWAPTNSADVSAIASAYAESAASSKQDTLTFAYDADKISAINGSALAGQGGGGLVTAIGTSNSGITSLNNSGLVDTAALRSADYSSLYVQEPLYISASGDSSYIGISGDVGGIDSATCSAIASAYAESAASGKLDTTAQVVTATATQLYAGSAYLTSVNGNQISASRAGNAANASLANSAWYDGTGRLISALPDSATVSSIASAYAESAASSKQDTLSFAYNTADQISSINGSALAGGGVVTGDYVENSALDTATAHSATGSLTPLATGVSSISGQPLVPTYLANPTYQYGVQSTFVYMPASSIWTTADVATGIFSPLQYATGACLAMDAGNFKAYYKGNEWFVANTAYGYARGEVHQSRGSRVIVEHTGGSWAALSAKNSDANVTLNNGKFYGTAKMAVANSQAYVQVQRGNSDSKYNSAKLDTDYLKFYNGMTTGYLDPDDTASGTAYMPAETEYMYISSIPYWNGKADGSALTSYALSADVSGTVDLVSTQSANWGGSALQLSAGPGISLSLVDNVLLISTAAV